MDEMKTGLVETLDTLQQKETSLENTQTCPEKECEVCGYLYSASRVERAEFQGKVYQEEGWVFYDCEVCKANKREREIASVDIKKIEEFRLIQKLTDIFDGERPAREYTLDRFEADLQNKEAYDLAMTFTGQFDVYLWGPCGVGKTHLACAMLRQAVMNANHAIAMKPSKLSRYMRVKEATVQDERIRELARVGVLLIDEIGIGKETEFALQILQEILDMRADNYRTGLIITSNYSLDDLAAKLGEDAIPSRLRQMCKIIKIDGKDRRISGAKRS